MTSPAIPPNFKELGLFNILKIKLHGAIFILQEEEEEEEEDVIS